MGVAQAPGAKDPGGPKHGPSPPPPSGATALGVAWPLGEGTAVLRHLGTAFRGHEQHHGRTPHVVSSGALREGLPSHLA